jgi:hypothetical protein
MILSPCVSRLSMISTFIRAFCVHSRYQVSCHYHHCNSSICSVISQKVSGGLQKDWNDEKDDEKRGFESEDVSTTYDMAEDA